MNKVILLMAVGIMAGIMVPGAYADVSILSDYYEMGDFLKVGGNFNGYTTIDIVGDDFEKNYKADFNGEYQFGFPINEELGYTPGIYNVTISHNNNTKMQQFGLDVKLPVFTLFVERSFIYLNEYAYFFGQVLGIEPKDYSFNGNVLIQVLDSNGNLVEDNWKANHDTARTEFDTAATKSQFRAQINSGDTFRTTQVDANIFEDQGSKSIRPILDNGYRAYIKLDPTIYEPYHAYTLKVQHDQLIRTVNFMVLNYKDGGVPDNENICLIEQKNLDHLNVMLDHYNELDVPTLIQKYERMIDNFKFTGVCK